MHRCFMVKILKWKMLAGSYRLIFSHIQAGLPGFSVRVKKKKPRKSHVSHISTHILLLILKNDKPKNKKKPNTSINNHSNNENQPI